MIRYAHSMTTAQTASGEIDMNSLVAENLHVELRRQRWSDRAAATALGVTGTYVNRRTRGITPLTPADLAMFADFLNVPVGKFFQLPEMDSNHQPADSESAAEARELASVTELHPRRDDVEEIHEAVISSLVVNR